VTSSREAEARAEARGWEGLGAAGDLLRRVVEGGRVAPAYVFEGADLLTPREGARRFAAALVCSGSPRPCGTCSACRRVASGSHPDVHVRGRDKATVISVEALAEILERAHAAPFEAARQVFVLVPADAMAPEALAMYLKALEEPPASTTFVLVTSRPERLPETVLSRCQRVRFPSTSEAEVARILASEGVDPARAARAARLSGSSLARARRVAALALDEAVDAVVAAGLASPPRAATTAEEAIGALRARLVEAGESLGEEPREEAAAPPEALRSALDDAFTALLVTARDRAAGLEGGPLGSLPPAAAAALASDLASLASGVRRNANPVALWTEAAATVRRRAGIRPAARGERQ
jgi:DNA polymerase-3 subunit delta'